MKYFNFTVYEGIVVSLVPYEDTIEMSLRGNDGMIVTASVPISIGVEIKAGDRLLVSGSLCHEGYLFIKAKEINILSTQVETNKKQ